MSDKRLRELERRFAETNSREDKVRLERERVRAGVATRLRMHWTLDAVEVPPVSEEERARWGARQTPSLQARRLEAVAFELVRMLSRSFKYPQDIRCSVWNAWQRGDHRAGVTVVHEHTQLEHGASSQPTSLELEVYGLKKGSMLRFAARPETPGDAAPAESRDPASIPGGLAATWVPWKDLPEVQVDADRWVDPGHLTDLQIQVPELGMLGPSEDISSGHVLTWTEDHALRFELAAPDAPPEVPVALHYTTHGQSCVHRSTAARRLTVQLEVEGPAQAITKIATAAEKRWGAVYDDVDAGMGTEFSHSFYGRKKPIVWNIRLFPAEDEGPPFMPLPDPSVLDRDDDVIQFALIDHAAQHVKGVSYQLELPDGEVREGRFEGSVIKLEGIPPGECRLTLSDLDGDAWGLADDPSWDTSKAPRAVVRRHEVSDGDTLVGLAAEHALRPDTIWNIPENQELRSKSAASFLVPGDVVAIPEILPTTKSFQTGRLYRLLRRGMPGEIQLVFKASDGSRRRGVPFELDVRSRYSPQVLFKGETSKNGNIMRWVPPSATHGELRMDGEVKQLAIGTLQRLRTEAGMLVRLRALGCGDELLGDSELTHALGVFQHRYGLPMSRKADEATLTKLAEVYDVSRKKRNKKRNKRKNKSRKNR